MPQSMTQQHFPGGFQTTAKEKGKPNNNVSDIRPVSAIVIVIVIVMPSITRKKKLTRLLDKDKRKQ